MHITHIITGLNNGGAEAVLYRLCINDKKHKHTVISLMDYGKYGSLLEELGVEVYCINMHSSKVTFSQLYMLYNLLIKLKPDIVQTWMYHADLIGGIIARFSGVKSVYWNIRHATLEKDLSKKNTIYIAKLCAILSKFIPKGIICCAHNSLDIHVQLGYQRNKMQVIGNGYELDKFQIDLIGAKELKQELLLSHTDVVFGMVARFDPQKNHQNLLRALSGLRENNINFKVILVGSNMDESNRELIQWIKGYQLIDNVLLLGPRTDIPLIMNILDIHILSSSTEGFPNVLCEAMACGTPCITTDVGDAAYIVGDTGWVVPPRDSESLIIAILKAIKQKESVKEWQVRQKNVRQRIIDSFSIETMVEKYHQVWKL